MCVCVGGGGGFFFIFFFNIFPGVSTCFYKGLWLEEFWVLKKCNSSWRNALRAEFNLYSTVYGRVDKQCVTCSGFIPALSGHLILVMAASCSSCVESWRSRLWIFRWTAGCWDEFGPLLFLPDPSQLSRRRGRDSREVPSCFWWWYHKPDCRETGQFVSI